MSPKTSLAEVTESPFLEMLAGGTKGKVYDLALERMSVGRSEDNDIVISSEAVSRYHAIFERNDSGGWLVRDNQSKNGVQVNGQPVEAANLQSGDVVQVGNFVFRYSEPGMAPSAAPSMEPQMEPQMIGGGADGYAAPKKRGPNKRVVIYGAVALLVGFLYMSSQEDEKKPGDKAAEGDKVGELASKLARDFKLSPEPNLDNKVDKSKLVGIEDPLLKQAEQDMAKLDWSNSSLREAEHFFKRGQREYLSKNFARAIESFQTAISMFRGHELAEKYLRLAVYEAEQEAKKNMDMAVQYFEAMQYQRAIYHFTEVIALMAHRPTETIASESEKYIALCKKRLQAAELFP